MKNKYNLKGSANIIVILLLLFLLLYLAAVYVLPHTADPPRKELLQYMNDKYDTVFTEITEDNLPDGLNTTSLYYWAKDDNGIIVRTAAHPNDYFYVRKCNGVITDNYGCYLVQNEAQQIIHDQLSSVIDYDFKISCLPHQKQPKYEADMTSREYIDNCKYRLFIYICSDGKNREQDLEKIKSELVNIFNGTPNKSCFFTIFYFDQKYYDQINTSWGSEYFVNYKHSNWYGSGHLNDDISEFKWKYGE